MVMFANTAFMGYPVIQALYGESSIFYTTIFNVGSNSYLRILQKYQWFKILLATLMPLADAC